MREIGCVLGLAFVIGSACTVDETAPDGSGAGQGGEAPSLGGSSGASDSAAGIAGESTSSSAGASGAAAGASGAVGAPGKDGGVAGERSASGGAAGQGGTGAHSGAGGEVEATGGYAAEGGTPATTPELPPWEPPPGCRLVSETGAADGCRVSLDCARPQTFSCKPQADGTWQCLRGYGRASPIVITGLGGLGACHSAANFFLTGEDEVFSGEDVCSLESDSSTTACRRSRPCERSAAPGSGVSGKLAHRKTINCNGTPLRCSCDTGSLYRIEGLEPAVACERALEYCGAPNPIPTEFKDCVVTDALVDYLDNVCRAESSCSAVTELEPGIYPAFDPMIECDERGECWCRPSLSGPSASFETGEPTLGEDVTTCLNWLPACSPPLPTGPVEPSTCVNNEASVNELRGFCSLQRYCDRRASLGGKPVTMESITNIHCQLEDDGVWCRCNGEFGERFLNDAPYPDACVAALPHCPDPLDAIN
jgi:hypothetical protein